MFFTSKKYQSQLIFHITAILLIVGITKSWTNITEKNINQLYSHRNPTINQKECDNISKQGSKATYGEILYTSMQRILDDLKLSKKDVFYDLGCGTGKVVVQCYLNTKVKKTCGIELSPTRFNHVQAVKNELKEQNRIFKKRKLEFLLEDIQSSNLKDATAVYMCSTCYPDNLMKKLTKKLEMGKKDLRIVTLKKLAENKTFSLVKEYLLPTTWSQSLPVYLYEHKEYQNKSTQSQR
jgi:SAM-dependent methyltransferase